MKIALGEEVFDLSPLYPGIKIKGQTVFSIWTFDPSSDDYS